MSTRSEYVYLLYDEEAEFSMSWQEREAYDRAKKTFAWGSGDKNTRYRLWREECARSQPIPEGGEK
jgi:hypothetical protein